MTSIETTRRDLVLLDGWCMCPTHWGRVTAGDNVLSPKQDGRIWHVRTVEPSGEHVMVRLINGADEHVLELHVDDAVHVLESSVGMRRTEHLGAPAVRRRKRKDA